MKAPSRLMPAYVSEPMSTWKMRDRKGAICAIICIICLCLSGCETIFDNIMDNALSSQKQRDAELKRTHQNPIIMVEEAEREAKADHYQDIQRQEKKDAAARKKQFDDNFEKQLQSPP